MVLTDGFTPKQLSYITHQVFDQKAVLAPIVKAVSRLESEDPEAEIEALLTLACTEPMGPVHIELTSETARKTVSVRSADPACEARRPTQAGEVGVSPVEQIQALGVRLKKARKPIVVLGLEARAHEASIRKFVDALGCAVLATYKAKGVIPDSDPRVVGIFTGGSLEQEAIAASDLMILIGMDPVELILQPWRYTTPVVDIAACVHPVHYVEPEVRIVGTLTDTLNALLSSGDLEQSDWSMSSLAALRESALSQLAYLPVKYGVAPDRVAQLAALCCREAEVKPMFSIDAGAHMFSVAGFFPAERAGDVLISNGLATMAFALPAAISAAVQHRHAPVLSFTGDGGLMMCLGELCTAVEQQAKVIVIVFNDSALSLIDIKQQSRSMKPEGVRWRHHDFAATMTALGGLGIRVASEQAFIEGMQQALAHAGPSLLDVSIDPSGYPEQLKAMRG